MTENQIEQIQAFIDGEMEPEERESFRQQLEKDEELSTAYHTYLAIEAHMVNDIKHADENTLKNTLTTLGNEFFKTVPQKSSDDLWKQLRRKSWIKSLRVWQLAAAVVFGIIIGVCHSLINKKNVNRQIAYITHQLDSVKRQSGSINNPMKISSYQPTQVEVDRLTGIWKVYTGPPPVIMSETDYVAETDYLASPRMATCDIMQVTYERGIFKYTRYGRQVDDEGYMQFDKPGRVIVTVNIPTNESKFSTLSQLLLKADKDTLTALSALWYWGGAKNIIIPLREVYIKIGNGGAIKPLPKLFHAPPKLFLWTQENGRKDTLVPKVENIYKLSKSLQLLLNENSVIGMILEDQDSTAFAKKPVK